MFTHPIVLTLLLNSVFSVTVSPDWLLQIYQGYASQP